MLAAIGLIALAVAAVAASFAVGFLAGLIYGERQAALRASDDAAGGVGA